ncbi:hypothetical protein RHSIM_Rhsim08G0099600 [Rhododendron simsii]|uniref:BHLH domain-containing protein n=1 Tax=Rhododendron simsii TaxID=118357 RepID=A0A834LGH8_RHOSS|nr:hypothetical protein RHSIM_Rhsim08G0099600 [Rhododendron simsii]
MADMYNNKSTCASSTSPPETDDLSLFLHQILLRSSDPLAAAASLPGNPHRPVQPSVLSEYGCHVTDRISTAESSSGLNSSPGAVFSSSSYYFPAGATNASSSVGTVDIDADEYDGESEDILTRVNTVKKALTRYDQLKELLSGSLANGAFARPSSFGAPISDEEIAMNEVGKLINREDRVSMGKRKSDGSGESSSKSMRSERRRTEEIPPSWTGKDIYIDLIEWLELGSLYEREGFEALVEEVPTKQVPSRSSLKRGRAAEFHNLSEKRRRSRINEKMKALQNLIPNSNKTDKASMLDDAIEYLKQLQLQVQMLTMRNGLSLYPMCLPGALQPVQLTQMPKGFYEGNGMDVTGISFNQETSTNTFFDIPNQSTNPAQLTAVDLSSTLSSETLFGRESAIEGDLRPLQFHTSSNSKVNELYRKDMPHDQQLNVDDHSPKNPLGGLSKPISTIDSVLVLTCVDVVKGFETGAKATVSISINTQASEVKDKVEACISRMQRPENVHLSNLECEPTLAPNLDGLLFGRSAAKDDIKSQRQDF